jgi:hypothetical protein
MAVLSFDRRQRGTFNNSFEHHATTSAVAASPDEAARADP